MTTYIHSEASSLTLLPFVSAAKFEGGAKRCYFITAEVGFNHTKDTFQPPSMTWKQIICCTCLLELLTFPRSLVLPVDSFGKLM